MTAVLEIENAFRVAALRKWVESSRIEFQKAHRYPKISFDAGTWQLRDFYRTRISNIYLARAFATIAGRRSSYQDAIRCDLAEIAIEDELKSAFGRLRAWRMIIRGGPQCLHDLNSSHLRSIESDALRQSEATPSISAAMLASLQEVGRIIRRLAATGVVEAIAWSIKAETRRALQKRLTEQRKSFRVQKSETLDRQIEALRKV